MQSTSEVTVHVLETIVQTIGRKTSEDYAVIVVRGVLSTLQQAHPSTRFITIKNTRYLEFGSCIEVDAGLEQEDPNRVGAALKDLLRLILDAMGKSAGYFFIKEVKERLGPGVNDALLRMNVDLTLMQFSQEVKARQADPLALKNTDVVRRVLGALIALVERQTGRTEALHVVSSQVVDLAARFPFLSDVRINDLRYSLGADEVLVETSVNEADAADLGAALERIIQGVEGFAEGKGLASVVEGLRSQLTHDYVAKLDSLGVHLDAYRCGNGKLLGEVVRALVTALATTTSEASAVETVSGLLRSGDGRFAFLHGFSVRAAPDGRSHDVTVASDLPEIADSTTRRAIQHLLEAAANSLPGNDAPRFISAFQQALDRRYLKRLDTLGVNLHLITLHQEIRQRAGG